MTDTQITWWVICSDGRLRHREPFRTQPEAAHWAEWGHCCTLPHKFMRVDTASCLTGPATERR